jgi:gas vesicle protein
MRDEGAAGAVAAFLLGAITGAAVALLMAPASGEETRRMIGDRAREGRDRASEAARQGREFVNRQRETIVSAVERGREAYNQARGATITSPQAGTQGTPGTQDAPRPEPL